MLSQRIPLVLSVAVLTFVNVMFREVWSQNRNDAPIPVEPVPVEPPLEMPLVIPGPRPEDCGLRSLYLLCRTAGIAVAIDELKQKTGTSTEGTTLLGLKRAAADLGFQVSARHLTSSELMDHLKQPRRTAILFCRTNHFVAAVGMRNDRFLVVDPATAIQELDDSTLSSKLRWSGKALLLTAPARGEGL